MPEIREHKWMPLSSCIKYENEAIHQKVSEVARASGGFMHTYKRVKSWEKMRDKLVESNKPMTWGVKRRNFINRHIVQYEQNPTYRRWLALVMWAYWPGKTPATAKAAATSRPARCGRGIAKWKFGERWYEGPLLPKMETATHCYARTHNGNIKMLSKRSKNWVKK